MKKAFALLFAAILILATLAGCGSHSDSSTSYSGAVSDSNDYDYEVEYEGETGEDTSDAAASGSGAEYSNTATAEELSEKIIYTASAEVETVDFGGSVDGVYDLLDEYQAFLESSYVSGANYSTGIYGNTTYRYARFTIRVPSGGFEGLTDRLSGLGNVTYIATDTENITTKYYDLEARLEAYETEEERLLEMLESAETVSDMILIEDRLSEVRYNIESAQTTLNSWQTQVNYSTVELQINEVEELTEKTETHLTYGEEITTGFKSTLSAVGGFFKGLFKCIVIALPVIVILAVVAIVTVFISVRAARRKRARKIPPNEDKK